MDFDTASEARDESSPSITGRRALREELQATWTVYEPRVRGVPMREKDLADADERAALDEPSHPGAPILPATRTAAPQQGGTLTGLVTAAILARAAK